MPPLTLLACKLAVVLVFAAPPARVAQEPSAAGALAPTPVRFVLELTRADARPSEPVEDSAARVLAAPTLSTLNNQTGSVQVTGGDLSYSVSLSPALNQAGDGLSVQWSLRLGGRSLPGGVTSVTLTGASALTPGKTQPLAEVTLRDPKTGALTRFRLLGRASVGAGAAAAGNLQSGVDRFATGYTGSNARRRAAHTTWNNKHPAEL